MPLDTAKRVATARLVRGAWLALTAWRSPGPRHRAAVDFGRCPIRPAIGPADPVEPWAGRSQAEARLDLGALIESWPRRVPRLAIEGDTGLGKTTLAIKRCAQHATGCGAICEGAVLYVVHDIGRVSEVVSRLRTEVTAQHGDPGSVSDLLGRQRSDAVLALRFGCREYDLAQRFGARGRRVGAELCPACPSAVGCKTSGYLAHTREAHEAAVVVTPVAKLVGIPRRLWRRIGAVICDEDVLPGLVEEFWVLASEVGRACRYIRRLRGRKGSRPQTFLAVLPLLEGIAAAMKRHDGAPVPLVDLLPEDCERYATGVGLAELAAAAPKTVRRTAGRETFRPDERAPAPWELVRDGSPPRQVWGRLVTALHADLSVGGRGLASTVRVVGRRPAKSRLHVLRFRASTLRALRVRPLLLMDATLHPAIAPVLEVERRVVRYDQGRTIVQALGPLLRLADLRERSRLSARGCRLVAVLAGWFDGRHGHVLCRKDLAPLLEAEARRYLELRHATFVTPRRERGWDADPRAQVFVVLGRYAKNGTACEREAQALRSAMLQLTGSTETLDALKPPSKTPVYQGRGRPVRYRGEVVERVTSLPDDPLAALLQDADRVATVRQFVGRDRTGTAEVLLLRGDPTIAVDALAEYADLPTAVAIRTPSRVRMKEGAPL